MKVGLAVLSCCLHFPTSLSLRASSGLSLSFLVPRLVPPPGEGSRCRFFFTHHHPKRTSCSLPMTTSPSSSSSSRATTASTTRSLSVTHVPMAKRQDDRVVYAGVPPAGWPADVLRQSVTSREALLDPPVPIPDPYGWLRDETRSQPDVLEHLKIENEYTSRMTEHLEPLRRTLYEELVSSIQETDYTTPRPHGNEYVYYTRTLQGKSYTIHCRAPLAEATSTAWDGQIETPVFPHEQVTLDVNELAKDREYCTPGSVVVSPSHRLLAYAADFTGNEIAQFFVQDLDTKEMIFHDENLEIEGSIRWGADDDTLFYLKLDPAHRPYQVYRRKLSTNEETLLYEENDDDYWMGIYKSLDGKYLFIDCSSKETSEIWYLDLQDPEATLQCIAPRRSKVLYEVEHHKGHWIIQSNVGGLPNMALWRSPSVPDSQDQWELITCEGDTLFDGGLEKALSDVTCFRNHWVFQGREGGIPRVWVASLNDGGNVKSLERLTFEEDAYDVGLLAHYEYDTEKITVAYDSMISPPMSIEIDLNDTSERRIVKTKCVPGYVKDDYACERTTVLSRDGTTHIPVSLVYRKSTMEQHLESGKPVHVHLYGYGSYGSCMESDFSSQRLPLLNRGIVYVIAHVRGGGEMGRQWYEEPNGAKYLCKKNTFNDFVDVARWLIDDRKLTEPEKLSCEGRSAGGMLIGASINQAPELFKMAVLGVPFLDVVCTMIDARIPLTTAEWAEWGNPSEVKYHSYMMEYCPMQNIQKGAVYPACLLTGGLHDPRVAFWEPAKFAATLRHEQCKEGSGPVCVKMDMSAGHFSASDRYKYLKELAFDYAFLLDQVGLA